MTVYSVFPLPSGNDTRDEYYEFIFLHRPSENYNHPYSKNSQMKRDQ